MCLRMCVCVCVHERSYLWWLVHVYMFGRVCMCVHVHVPRNHVISDKLIAVCRVQLSVCSNSQCDVHSWSAWLAFVIAHKKCVYPGALATHHYCTVTHYYTHKMQGIKGQHYKQNSHVVTGQHAIYICITQHTIYYQALCFTNLTDGGNQNEIVVCNPTLHPSLKLSPPVHQRRPNSLQCSHDTMLAARVTSVHFACLCFVYTLIAHCLRNQETIYRQLSSIHNWRGSVIALPK